MKIIVSRHEKDLQYIIKKYNLLYNQSLNDHLKVIFLFCFVFFCYISDIFKILN